MKQKKMDQEKKQLEAWMDKFVGRFPRHIPVIEYKQRNFPLMVVSQEYKDDETEEFIL